MVKVYMLPAEEGDFLWIAYGEEIFSHIIIDGGLEKNAWVYADVIETIYRRKETVSALVLTHIDIDHIQGAIKGISELAVEVLKCTVKNIYFNTCRGIWREYHKKDASIACGENDIRVKRTHNGYGVSEAITFLELLKEKEMDNCLKDYIISGDKIKLDGGAVLKVISPGEKELRNLSLKWERYEKKQSAVGYANNIQQTREDLNSLKKEKMTYDRSINNRSSIAMIFEYEKVKIALLADAAPTVCLDGLKRQGIYHSFNVDLFKVSHHGSRSNTSDKLLKALPADHYLFSTDGHGKQVPSKVMLAHLLDNAGDCPEHVVHVLCNYRWWETTYHGKYFTEQDREDYFLSGRLDLRELDEKAVIVKDGLEVYGEYV